ncbi:hypothetical protein AMTRI_Chr11g98890 [Amborella trichopoda]
MAETKKPKKLTSKNCHSAKENPPFTQAQAPLMVENKKPKKPPCKNRHTSTEKPPSVQGTPMVETRKPKKPLAKSNQNCTEKPPSWTSLRNILTCKQLQAPLMVENTVKKQSKRMGGCSVSLCSSRENTRVMHRPETSPEKSSSSSSLSLSKVSLSSGSSSKRLAAKVDGFNASNRSMKSTSVVSEGSGNGGSSFRGMHLRRLSGCYECHMVVDPINGVFRDPSLRNSICACPECGEIFMRAENLELHQAVKHAVSEIGPEDSSRNIVEIIFQSSWLKETPVCKIDRILKVHNSQKTINRFEDYRDTVKSKANKLPKKHPRCIADGNELLRFFCTTFSCSIGTNGSSSLCNSVCNVCNIIKNGFKVDKNEGIITTASSGKAHDSMETELGAGERRAMLVCRVIAGRVKKNQEATEDGFCGGFDSVSGQGGLYSSLGFDSVAGQAGLYSSLDELFVFNPRAILPCFVVIYRNSD